MVTGFKRRELEPVVDEHDQRVRELQQDLLQLHASIERRSPGEPAYDSTLREIFAVTEELLDYEAGIAAARAAARAARYAAARRRQRLIMWWLVGGVAAAGALVVLLAVTGVLGTPRAAVGAAVLITGAAMALSMTARVARSAGRWALTLRRAVVLAAASAFGLICAAFWTPGSFIVVPAVALAVWPLVTSGADQEDLDG